ncbi:olfactory receptor 2A25-like [Periophthalmus magnuspinnatus]|uniref:olfactory receptor 2A25-like n=1 Tax=Periophthalmus magnuspinnatus TaxID=409849 RepID=UPI002436D6AF|nr:olfactory receptor 2A25-like [Periophthalmus magnuspinnatus]
MDSDLEELIPTPDALQPLVQMSNSSVVLDPVVFVLEGFRVAPGYGPLLFLLLLCIFLLVLAGNGLMLVAVATERRLWRPMFVLMVNLALVDLLGASAICPRLLMLLLYAGGPISYRSISHAHALLQAIAVHTYGVAMLTVLAAMAYDRYVAVCEPLRYHSVMTPLRVFWLCFWSWFLAVVLIGILFGFHIGTKFCGTLIQHVYCSNRGILQLSCEPSPVNNYYGLVMTYAVGTSVLLVTTFSYIRILMAVLGRGGPDPVQTRSKALQTCSSHLVVFVLYNVSCVIIVISYRFPALAPNIKKLFSILFIIVPPTVNPLIYGLVSHELRSAICRRLRRVAPKRQS